MKGMVLLDTMHLNVKYPRADVFERLYRNVAGIDYRKLRAGILNGEFVLRPGASGYRVSAWLHDARAFFTDSVDDQVGEGNGMGIWVQVGPKFLLEHGSNLLESVCVFLQSIGVKGTWPMRITRPDVAVDLFGISMQELDIEKWRVGWVGRSKVSACHFNSRTGALETISIGARGSPVYLRVYDKVAQATKEGDIEMWRAVWGMEGQAVTRVEWETKPKAGGFEAEVTELELLTKAGIARLVSYLLGWGSLRERGEAGSVRWRWEEGAFWKDLRGVVDEWSGSGALPMVRSVNEFAGVTERYVRFLGGAISGGMARFDAEAPGIVKLLEGMEKHGVGLATLQRDAERKGSIYSKL